MKIDLAAKTLLAALARTNPLVVAAAWQLVHGRQRMGTATPAYVQDMRGKLLGLGLVESELAATLALGLTPPQELNHHAFVARAYCHLCEAPIDFWPPTTETYARAHLTRMKTSVHLHADHAPGTECLGVLTPIGVTRG